MSLSEEWVICQHPEIGDVVRWNEPIWAAPSKPRGKGDAIGEQQITARLTNAQNIFTLTVIHVTKLSDAEATLKVAEYDVIMRKKSSLQKGNCHKLAA